MENEFWRAAVLDPFWGRPPRLVRKFEATPHVKDGHPRVIIGTMATTVFGEWQVQNHAPGRVRLDLSVAERNSEVLVSLGPAGFVGDSVTVARLEIDQARELACAIENAVFRASGAGKHRGPSL